MQCTKLIDIKSRLEQLLNNIELTTGQKQVPDVRRSVWRYDWIGSATVSCIDSDDSPELLYVSVSRVSRAGLEFRCSSELECGQKVMIILELDDRDLEIPVTVKHSTASVGRYVIGVEFDL